MKKTEVMKLCGHCGHYTLLKLRAKFIQKGKFISEELMDVDFANDEDFEEFTVTYQVLQCTNCLQPTFSEVHSIESAIGDENILYPANKDLHNLPKTIDNEYKSALKLKYNDPAACAVRIRRTLEAICKHENAQGKVLADKLKNLADASRLPQTLALMAQQLKNFGNLGAHYGEEQVHIEDIQTMLEFVEAILEYLYVAPAKVAQVQRRFDKKKLDIS